MFLYYLSAVLLVLSFPRFDWWVLAWVSLVPLFVALDHKRYSTAFRIGYFCGVLFFGAMLFWLCFVTRLGTVLFVAYLALYIGLFGLGYRRLSQERLVIKIFLIPALWVALEYVRAHLLTGFGWICLGYTQSKNLWLAQIADLTGVYGLSFLIVMVNVFLKEVLVFLQDPFRGARKKELIGAFFLTVLFWGASLGYGALRYYQYATPDQRSVSHFTVGVAQGNVPHERRWHPQAWPLILRDYGKLSQKLAAQGADLIVWPESAYPGYCWEDPQLFARLQAMIHRQNVAHLIGIVTQENERYFNSALAFDRQGQIVERYHKLRLVPFGEFIPFRQQIPFLSEIVPIDDFTPGKDFVLFEVPGKKGAKRYFYSVLICFEDTLPDVARGFVRHGANVLINISNDAWFEDTKEPFLHLQNSVFRSIENRRWLVRCGNVGVSCFVTPRGQVTAVAVNGQNKPTYVESTSIATASLLDSQTVYTKFGDWFAYFCISGILLGIILINIQKYRSKTKDA